MVTLVTVTLGASAAQAAAEASVAGVGVAGDGHDAGTAHSGGARRAGRAGWPCWAGCARGADSPVAAAASCDRRRKHARQREQRPARRSPISSCPTRSVHGCSPSSIGMELGVLNDASLPTAIFLPACAVDLFQIKIAANCVVRNTRPCAPARSSHSRLTRRRRGQRSTRWSCRPRHSKTRPERQCLPVRLPAVARPPIGQTPGRAGPRRGPCPRVIRRQAAYLLTVASSMSTA